MLEYSAIMAARYSSETNLALKLHEEFKSSRHYFLREEAVSATRLARLRARPWATLPLVWKRAKPKDEAAEQPLPSADPTEKED